ncbi:kinase-like domain-containing protein [Rhizophagus clarus]|uniref:Kinase-like domain-containing protein n=1 Tax=Rhizophagus clarus TaxID=94130 RepID=A0A8H3QJZ6_9GLOM|nr:kinase-like domain-containing protein [Rhizophagus clarus]
MFSIYFLIVDKLLQNKQRITEKAGTRFIHTLNTMNQSELNELKVESNPESHLLLNRYGKCEECGQIMTDFNWCYACNVERFRENFKNWTSGNENINKFIQETQLSAKQHFNILEWISYERFRDVKYIAKGGFGKVYRAKWKDGYIFMWDNKIQNWGRLQPNMFVALKSLNNSKNVTSRFISEVTFHYNSINTYIKSYIVRFYGITRDPETENYMMVLEYAERGSLRNFLDQNHSNLNWGNMIQILLDIACGLDQIHQNELIHRDLHIGNILCFPHKIFITDMGLCKPADCDTIESIQTYTYGILPYIAPEILRGQTYTKAADIYSFGIIMYEVISGLPPYHDISHDKNLAIKICQGLRPKFKIKVPQLILHLIKQCLDADHLNRPNAKEIKEILVKWKKETNSRRYNQTELIEQIKEAEEMNNNLSNMTTTAIPPINSSLSYETHSEAIYTSRLLNFNNLPEPINSYNYYKSYDNISNMEYLELIESLQIDISQLKISNTGI